MHYQVRDGDKTYGPLTLAELHAEVQSGRIAPTALVQSQGMADWLPASAVLGNIPIPAAAPQVQPPPPRPVRTVPLPPNLHWAILLILVIVTNQLFNWIWAIVLGNWARKLENDNKPLVLVTMYPAGLIAGIIAASVDDLGAIFAFFLIFGGLISYLVGIFTIKHAMESYYNSTEKIGLTLSGVGTFVLSTIYLQYHVNRIAKMKKKGQLHGLSITSS
jgi:hypothetical protein